MNAARAAGAAFTGAWRASWDRYLRDAKTYNQAAAYRKVAMRWAAYWAIGTAGALPVMWLFDTALDLDVWIMLIVMVIATLAHAGRALYFHGVLAGRRVAWNEGYAAAQRTEADRVANRIWRSGQRAS